MYIQTDNDNKIRGYSPTEMIPAEVYDGELPEDFRENWFSYRLVDGELVYDDTIKQSAEQRRILTEEQTDLLDWFDWYDVQIMQYERCQRLDIPFDGDITELDAQAKVNQARLREIKIILGE